MASQNNPKKKRLPQYTLKKVWFFNGDLVSIHHKNRAAGIITLYNWIRDSHISVSYKDSRRFRRKAYSIVETAELLNRNPNYFGRKIREGIFPKPMARAVNGIQTSTYPSYYTEEQVFKIRDIMSVIHRGHPRNDGLVTNNTTPTEDQLRAKINNSLLVYVRDEDGNFIPTFDTYYG